MLFRSTAANPLVLMGAGRSIPDILLLLFLTISAWGFLEILINEHPARRFYWMAYLGAALAFETKGLPAAAFAGISFLYLLFNPWKPKKLMELMHPLAIISAIVVALSWFVVMYLNHGTEYLNSFFADQVGYRVSSKSAQVVTNTFLGVVNLAAFTLPWLIVILSCPVKLKKFIAGTSGETKALLGFIALWVIAVIAMSGAVFKFYDRYLLPVIPLTSLFIGMVITQTETRFMAPALKVLMAFNLLVLLINSMYALLILPDVILIAGTLTGIVFFIVFARGKNIFQVPGVTLAGSVMLLWFNIHLLLYTLLMPHPGKQLAETIQKENVSGQVRVYVYGNIRMASAIRIYSNNDLNVVSMDSLFSLPSGKEHLLVFNGKEEHLLDLKDYRVMSGSEEWKRVSADRFPGFMQPAAEKLKNSGTRYFIAKPKDK